MDSGINYKWNEKDSQLVKDLVSFNINQEAIALRLDMSLPTLHKYYRSELDVGNSHFVEKCARALAEKVEAGDTTAIIFALKTRGRWKSADGEALESIANTLADVKAATEQLTKEKELTYDH